MDYSELCKKVLSLDSKIRYAGVVNTQGDQITSLNQDGVEDYLSPSELKMSIHYSIVEWEKSQNLQHKIGFEKASAIEYDKVTLISIPINKRDLFVASMEPNEDYFKMISKIKPIIQNLTKN